MNALRRCERSLFVTLSKGVVVLLFLLFAVISVAQNSWFVAALAGVGVFVTARILLPLEAISDTLEWFSSGGAGKWLHNSYLRIMPGRSPDDRRRGQTAVKELLALGMIVLMVSSLAVSGVAVAQEETNTTSVEHDYLNDESYVSEFDDTSSVESTDRNVKTQIEQTEAFVRLKAENPNAYPVDMTIQVHPDIVPPAEVGEVSDTDGDVISTWRNTHDFDRDQRYTEITFTMEANSEVTFAPSRIRVLSISWKDSATTTDGLLDRIPNPFEDKTLDERTYELNSSDGSMVTVPLERGDKSIDEWQAAYRTGPDDNWKPISTNSDDPAFYRTVDGGQSVQFHFDTDNYDAGGVEIEFTANPNYRDKAKHDFRSFSAGWSDIIGFDLLSINPATPLTEVGV